MPRKPGVAKVDSARQISVAAPVSEQVGASRRQEMILILVGGSMDVNSRLTIFMVGLSAVGYINETRGENPYLLRVETVEGLEELLQTQPLALDRRPHLVLHRSKFAIHTL